MYICVSKSKSWLELRLSCPDLKSVPEKPKNTGKKATKKKHINSFNKNCNDPKLLSRQVKANSAVPDHIAPAGTV